MADPITTTITFDELIHGYDDELENSKDAFEDAQAYAQDEYGEHKAEWPDDVAGTVAAYNQSAKQIQKRQNLLETLQEKYDGDEFEIKMLSGSELMDLETELRIEAQKRGVELTVMTSNRQRKTVDVGVVDAPEDFPTDDDGSPKPSDAPSALTLALFEHVDRFSNAGETDFRAPGFDDSMATSPSDALAHSKTQSDA